MTLWRFRKIQIMCFCCGQLSSLAILTKNSIYKKWFFSRMFFKGIFFVEMQAERRAFGTKNCQKMTCKDQDGILMKIFNDKRWPQQEDVFCNLRNFENVKNKLKKNRISWCCFLFLSNSKGILYKALHSVNECSVKLREVGEIRSQSFNLWFFGGAISCVKIVVPDIEN